MSFLKYFVSIPLLIIVNPAEKVNSDSKKLSVKSKKSLPAFQGLGAEGQKSAALTLVGAPAEVWGSGGLDGRAVLAATPPTRRGYTGQGPPGKPGA